MWWQEGIFLIFTYDGFEFINGNGYYLVATYATAAVLGDDEVILDANTSEVVIVNQSVVIDKLTTLALFLPLLDEGRDEVDTRLIAHYYTGAQLPSATIGAAGQLGSARSKAREVEVVNIAALTYGLAVVYIESHTVTQSVGHKHKHCSCGNGFFGVAFEQTEVGEVARH